MAIDTDQNHYVPQLRPIYFTSLKSVKNEELVSIEFKGAFMNLLEGLALPVPTRPDILVFMGRLQRHAGAAGHRLDRHQQASEVKCGATPSRSHAPEWSINYPPGAVHRMLTVASRSGR
jgi:hypothetical protein